ncbi:MAG TPA: hypothetical protein VGO17_18745 [Aurantimonas sp.]|jgi:hypothetical protein|nr:hypothetical protein [Aurantimonas sp.]
MWKKLGTLFAARRAARSEPARMSRRRFLAGFGAIGGLAVVAPALLRATPAAAAEPADDPTDEGYEVAQRWDDRRDRRGDRRWDRRWDRRDRRWDRRDRRHRRREGRRRYNRRDLVRSCQRDPRFRRDNRGLCRQVIGSRGRRGACVNIGPITICD